MSRAEKRAYVDGSSAVVVAELDLEDVILINKIL